MTISQLRDMFYAAPSLKLFIDVYHVVRANPTAEVLQYALGHLDSWEDQGLRSYQIRSGIPHLGDPSPLLFRFLNLLNNWIGDEGVAALAASPYLKNLTSLGLGRNWIGDAGAAALAASPYLKDVKVVF